MLCSIEVIKNTQNYDQSWDTLVEYYLFASISARNIEHQNQIIFVSECMSALLSI